MKKTTQTAACRFCGQMAQNQKEWMEFLAGQGYRVAACYHWEYAARLLEDYLRGKEAAGSGEEASGRQQAQDGEGKRK